MMVPMGCPGSLFVDQIGWIVLGDVGLDGVGGLECDGALFGSGCGRRELRGRLSDQQ